MIKIFKTTLNWAKGRSLSSRIGGSSPKWKMYTLSASSTDKSSRCVSKTQDGFDLATDTPKDMGGANSAAQPVYHLMCALVGCKTATARFVARNMKLRLGAIDFDIVAKRDQRGSMDMPIDT